MRSLQPYCAKKPWWHNPYTTRQLVELCLEQARRNLNDTGRPVVYINGAWRLQIRGKHLRRLAKKLAFEDRGSSLLITDKRVTND